MNKINYISVTTIAEYFKLSAKELNQLFISLNWAKKENRWWIATELGLNNGAKQVYNTKSKLKYIQWDENVVNNSLLITAIQSHKEEIHLKGTNTVLTKQEKKAKGTAYEDHVARHYESLGFYVWEHGKELGVKDAGIDLILKKDNEFFFVQCKNWDKWKINDRTVKATMLDVLDYLENKQGLSSLLTNYQQKILYITPKECLTKAAYTYIKNNSDRVEYHIIPFEN